MIVYDRFCIFLQVAAYVNFPVQVFNWTAFLVSADHLRSLALLCTQNVQALLEINLIEYQMNIERGYMFWILLSCCEPRK